MTHVGWKAIKRNWEDYWPTFSRFSVSMTVTALSINGPVGWVHGIETSRRRSKAGEVTSSRNFGTNFSSTAMASGGWRFTNRWLFRRNEKVCPPPFVTIPGLQRTALGTRAASGAGARVLRCAGN